MTLQKIGYGIALTIAGLTTVVAYLASWQILSEGGEFMPSPLKALIFCAPFSGPVGLSLLVWGTGRNGLPSRAAEKCGYLLAPIAASATVVASLYLLGNNGVTPDGFTMLVSFVLVAAAMPLLSLLAALTAIYGQLAGWSSTPYFASMSLISPSMTTCFYLPLLTGLLT